MLIATRKSGRKSAMQCWRRAGNFAAISVAVLQDDSTVFCPRCSTRSISPAIVARATLSCAALANSKNNQFRRNAPLSSTLLDLHTPNVPLSVARRYALTSSRLIQHLAGRAQHLLGVCSYSVRVHTAMRSTRLVQASSALAAGGPLNTCNPARHQVSFTKGNGAYSGWATKCGGRWFHSHSLASQDGSAIAWRGYHACISVALLRECWGGGRMEALCISLSCRWT